MLLFKELIESLLLLLTILLLLLIIMKSMVLVELKKKNDHKKYFLPRVNITDYKVLIDSRNFYDQPINDQIKKI